MIKVLNVIYRQVFPDESDLRFQVLAVAMQSTSFCSCRFSLCQTFLIMFVSGDRAGQVNVFILFFNRYSMTERALWTGALSSWKIQLFSGKCRAITGHKLSSSMSIYLLAFIFPSTKSIVPLTVWIDHILWLGEMTVHLYHTVDSGVHFIGKFSKLFVVSNWRTIWQIVHLFPINNSATLLCETFFLTKSIIACFWSMLNTLNSLGIANSVTKQTIFNNFSRYNDVIHDVL